MLRYFAGVKLCSPSFCLRKYKILIKKYLYLKVNTNFGNATFRLLIKSFYICVVVVQQRQKNMSIEITVRRETLKQKKVGFLSRQKAKTAKNMYLHYYRHGLKLILILT